MSSTWTHLLQKAGSPHRILEACIRRKKSTILRMPLQWITGIITKRVKQDHAYTEYRSAQAYPRVVFKSKASLHRQEIPQQHDMVHLEPETQPYGHSSSPLTDHASSAWLLIASMIECIHYGPPQKPSTRTPIIYSLRSATWVLSKISSASDP